MNINNCLSDVADSMMMKQKKHLDDIDVVEQAMSFLDLLQTSSVVDLIQYDPLLTDEELEGFQKHKNAKPNPRPYVSVNDLNNTKEEPYLNKPKAAVEIGVKFEF